MGATFDLIRSLGAAGGEKCEKQLALILGQQKKVERIGDRRF